MLRAGVLRRALFVSTVVVFPLLAAAPEIRNVVLNPVSGVALGEHRDWIYLRSTKISEWTKLIPGTCPQWFPDGKRFIFFLPTGYSINSQLWSANGDGEGRYILTQSEYLIRETPVITDDAKEIAFHYSTCVASGSFEDVVVIDLRKMQYPSYTCEAKVVYRAKAYTKIQSLRWVGKDRLTALVNGTLLEIDTHGKGMEPVP